MISLCISETFLLLFRKLRNLNLKTVIDSQTRPLKTVHEGPIENGRIKKKIYNLCIDVSSRISKSSGSIVVALKIKSKCRCSYSWISEVFILCTSQCVPS